ncbi:MAG: hypothetical protein A2804_03090 [Candidatus Pacebacteria bacterium RIFCSPHIGHO2_01_FULL_46_10]|nr:MAG: hypothetical protein A2804_03090 [Candidatus Pacebacteria bacterium RIFCSPHIGHO2_01_FULL_46_10]
MKKFFYFDLPVVLWMALIFILSSQPHLPSAQNVWIDFLFKKSAHIFVYGVLYTLSYRAQTVHRKKKGWVLPLLFTLAYAVSDEFHQSFVPGRTPMVRDIGFDAIGAGIAMYLLNRRWQYSTLAS